MLKQFKEVYHKLRRHNLQWHLRPTIPITMDTSATILPTIIILTSPHIQLSSQWHKTFQTVRSMKNHNTLMSRRWNTAWHVRQECATYELMITLKCITLSIGDSTFSMPWKHREMKRMRPLMQDTDRYSHLKKQNAPVAVLLLERRHLLYVRHVGQQHAQLNAMIGSFRARANAYL